MAIDELQCLFTKCKIADMVHFDYQTNCIWCYAHIINIYCSNIITSFTSVPKLYLSQLKVLLNLNYAMWNDSVKIQAEKCP